MAGIIKVKEVSEMSAKKRYDVAFKKEIAQVYLDGQRTAPSLAEELGLHVNTIYKWAELMPQVRSFISIPLLMNTPVFDTLKHLKKQALTLPSSF
jgi:hypothetical protein